MRWTRAAFAERTTLSLKLLLYRYIEDVEYKHFHNLFQYITILNPSKNLLDRLDTKDYQEFRLPVHSVQQATTRI